MRHGMRVMATNRVPAHCAVEQLDARLHRRHRHALPVVAVR